MLPCYNYRQLVRILPTVHFTYKNIRLILIAALIVGAAFVLAEYRNREAKKVVYNAPSVTAALDGLTPELQEQDSDEDGLKDWEEVLLGTDSHKADTDGDGTKDGAEAASGRNPLVKGPNDKASDTAKDGTSARTLTPTEKIARDFFARYMELSQAGLAGDKASQQELIGQVLASGIVVGKPRTYASTDVIVTADNTPEAIRTYGNSLGAIFKANMLGDKNEMLIAKESMEKEDPELLKQIDPIIASYKRILSSLLKVSAPSTLQDNHLIMINSFSTLLYSAESVRKVDVDALAGIQGTTVWLGAVENLNKAFNTLKASFKLHKVQFPSTEPGSFFIIH